MIKSLFNVFAARLLATLLVAQSGHLWAAMPTDSSGAPIVEGPPATRFWTMSMGGQRFFLGSKEDHDVHGYAGQVSFGMSWHLRERWQLTGQAEVIAGPWDRIRNNSFDADFNGVGGTVDSLICVSRAECRSGDWTWAVAAALSYFDISGRSIGANRHDTGNPNERGNLFLEHRYNLNVSGLWIVPSVVWLKFSKPRPTGNTTELLTTRIEGVAFRAGVGIPLITRYRANFVKREEGSGASQYPVESTEKGKMTGYSVLMSFQAWLGT